MMNNSIMNIFNNLQKTETIVRTPNEHIFIVDSMNTFLRSFSMVKNVNSEGIHVGGLVGYLKSIGYGIKLYNPTKVILVFDGVANSTNKKYLFPEYKGNRDYSKITHTHIFDKKEDEQLSINQQIGRLVEYLKCLPVTIISIPKIEADDTIGFLCSYYENLEETKKITIMSADRDFLQLASDKTEIYSPTKKKTYTKENVQDEFEVHVNNYINYKVLLGDAGDNVPGIQGLGIKKLIKYFPELLEETPLSLKDIQKIAEERKDNHIIYERVLDSKRQLEINYKLMSLHELLIFDDDKESIIERINTSPPKLDIIKFLNMVSTDVFNDTTNWHNWLTTLFGSLN